MSFYPLFALSIRPESAIIAAAVLVGASVRVFLLLHQGKQVWPGWRRWFCSKAAMTKSP
jgi:hypothetical protein